MKLGCVAGAAVFGALLWLYWSIFEGRVDPPSEWLIAFLGAAFAAMGLGAIAGIANALRDRDALRRAASGAPFRDGRMIAASGPIHPEGAPLRSPFSGRECVAYEYAVHRQGPKGPVFAYAGYALAPAIIRAPTGGVRLLGYAMLEHFPAEEQSAAAVAEKANEWLASTRFDDVGVTRPGKMLLAIRDFLTDDDGSFRKDLRIDGGAALEGHSFRERIVGVGQEVTGLGTYSAARSGIVPSVARLGGSLNRIVPGDPAAARAELVGGGFALARAGAAFCLLMQAVLLFLWLVLPPWVSPAARPWRGKAVHDVVAGGDAAALDELLSRGLLDANDRGPSDEAPIVRARSADVVRVLLAHGADPDGRGSDGETALMWAARAGEAEMVRALLAAGADPNFRNDRWDGDWTALAGALREDRDETAALLRAAGARDDTVTAANGRALRPDGDEPFAACRRWLDAIRAGDRDSMKSLWAGRAATIDAADLDVWRSDRPVEPRLARGFANDDRATLVVDGETADGRKVAWGYQLRREAGRWRVLREWRREPD